MTGAVFDVLELGSGCTNGMYESNYLLGSPVELAKTALKGSGRCYFFPELEEAAAKFASEVVRNTSFGLDPLEKDAWEDEDRERKYCEWLAERLKNPEWSGEEVVTVVLTYLNCSSE
uniref:GDA1/CD39 (Nucleoside phosphatase) family protein n=1 Tax=Steinernema glaseri TaxID=37863 RepID=A0A1I7Y325_9BILA